MDKAVIAYKKRRQNRLNNRIEKNADSVEEFKERRQKRLETRLDAGIGWAYGLAKSKGIDTTGMSPKEVFEALKEEGGAPKPKKIEGKKSLKKKEVSEKAGIETGNNLKNMQKNVPDSNNRGSLYTSSFKSTSGVSYPKPKKGAVYDEDTLREVNRLADEKGSNNSSKADALGKTLKKLTEKDLTYQKDPEGQTVASIPGLSQMYDSKVVGRSPEVQAAYNKRVEGGKKIASDMVNISNKLGSRMMGLENCFKGGESTSRKIDKVKKKWANRGEQLSDEQALGRMDDVVRFSYKCDHDKMVGQIKGLEKELEKNGYEITERDNKFLPTESGEPRNYKAVHLQVKAPSGELFEVQIQSEETIKVKNKNHKYFEEQRLIDLKKNPEKKGDYDRLEKIMVDNVSKMKDPPGILDLPTIKKENNKNN